MSNAEQGNIIKKNDMLKRWLQNSKGDVTGSIPATDPAGLIPLSFSQKRLWFLHQLMPDSTGYNLPIVFQVNGQLDAKILEDSFRDVIQRHAILRTVFTELEGEPAQVICESMKFEFPYIDISMLQPDEKKQKAKIILDAEARVLFDLKSGPLFRPELIKLDCEEYLFGLTIHHIITDGWSNMIFLEELSANYEARVKGANAGLQELSIQYYDYARWQVNQFRSGFWDKHITFWKKYLEGAPVLMELPVDYPRPPVQTSKGAVYEFAVPETVLNDFRKFCQQEQLTPVMAFLAVFKLLIYRYTGETDMVVGLPVFNRPRKETEKLIGFFANTLAVRTIIPEGRAVTFRELLHCVRESALSAYEHQEMPFEKLVEVLQPERSTSHDPIIQTMLSIGAKSSETGNKKRMGASWTAYPIERNSANFDLALEITELGHPKFAFAYRTELFSPDTIKRLAAHFVTLLGESIISPDDNIDNIPLLSSAERELILREWNNTSVTYPKQSLHELIERQVVRTPNSKAVYFEGIALTYIELNERADKLAHKLKESGVETGQFVGISMERSLELVVGLLGILKAGAVYVPIDPDYPIDRITYMLEDSGVSVLLTQEKVEQQIQQLSGSSLNAEILKLDKDWPMISACLGDNSVNDMIQPTLAYMIYTSGSTGRPKGAVNTHQGICNRLLWMQDEFKLTPGDRVLQKTPFSFDVSVWEFFWPLLTGAALYIAKPGGHKDAAYLIDTILENGITTMHFVPSMLQVFLDEPGASQCKSLRRVIVSGEALSYDLQERFYECLSEAVLYNLYGPTEAAVDVTFWKCERGSLRRNVPIGRPVANTQIYILDRYLQPVPVGVAGELHIGGVQVGRGYHGREELTREKFIPDPYDEGKYLYKTGDLARFTQDGIIEYLGRMDYQVKLRGLRIELGEIEANMLLYPEIREAVVTVYEVSPDDKYLVAYFTSHGSSSIEAVTIRDFLSARLPEYMLPSFIIQLDLLPLSPNGKVDRKALPHPHSVIEQKKRTIVQPSTEFEKKLVNIWKEVLMLSEVGIQDNFFELGGHSLLVTKVRSKISEQCGVTVSMMDLFRYTTIQALVGFLSNPGETGGQTLKEAQSRAQKYREALQKRKERR